MPSQRFFEDSIDVRKRGPIFPMREPLESFADDRINLSLSPCLHLRVQDHCQYEDREGGKRLLGQCDQ